MTLNMDTLGEAIKEYYAISALPLHKQAMYYLICRYAHRVSDRLLTVKMQLRKEADVAFGEVLRSLIYTENPFLKLIPKENFSGTYYPVPIVYGDDNK